MATKRFVSKDNLSRVWTRLFGKVLNSKEEIEANTSENMIAGADAVKEVYSSLTANGSQLCMDYHDGKYGVNTDPERGADTFIPFKASTPYAFLSFYDYSSTPNRTKLNVIAYSEFECDSNILTVKEAGTYRILCPQMYYRGLYVWINDKIVFSCGNLGTIDKSVALNDGDKIYISVDDGSVQHTSRSGFIVKIE